MKKPYILSPKQLKISLYSPYHSFSDKCASSKCRLLAVDEEFSYKGTFEGWEVGKQLYDKAIAIDTPYTQDNHQFLPNTYLASMMLTFENLIEYMLNNNSRGAVLLTGEIEKEVSMPTFAQLINNASSLRRIEYLIEQAPRHNDFPVLQGQLCIVGGLVALDKYIYNLSTLSHHNAIAWEDANVSFWEKELIKLDAHKEIASNQALRNAHKSHIESTQLKNQLIEVYRKTYKNYKSVKQAALALDNETPLKFRTTYNLLLAENKKLTGKT